MKPCILLPLSSRDKNIFSEGGQYSLTVTQLLLQERHLKNNEVPRRPVKAQYDTELFPQLKVKKNLLSKLKNSQN